MLSDRTVLLSFWIDHAAMSTKCKMARAWWLHWISSSLLMSVRDQAAHFALPFDRASMAYWNDLER